MKRRDPGRRSRSRTRFFNELHADPQLKAAAAWLVVRYASSPTFAGVAQSEDADLILSAFENLQMNPRVTLQPGEPYSGVLVSQMKRWIPSPALLLEREDLFPKLLRTARSAKVVPVNRVSGRAYRFRPVPRLFHAIWRGVTIGECIGGGAQSLESCTPERWSTAAITGAEVYFVEGDRYDGFVQVVPLVEGATGHRFASIDCGSAALGRRINSKQILFDKWLSAYAASSPQPWRGYLLSESNALNNAGALDEIRLNLSYVLGNPRPPGDFCCDDEEAHSWVGALPLRGVAREYGGRLIFDGNTRDARTLVELCLTTIGTEPATAAERLRERLHHKNPVMRWRAAIALLRQGCVEKLAIEILCSGLARTHRPRLIRYANILLRRQPQNKYTMELWPESVMLLMRHMMRGENTVEHHDRKLPQKIWRSLLSMARNGRNDSIREIALRACQKIEQRYAARFRIATGISSGAFRTR